MIFQVCSWWSGRPDNDQYPCHTWHHVWRGHHALQYGHQVGTEGNQSLSQPIRQIVFVTDYLAVPEQ
jgi:hypothetical protein